MASWKYIDQYSDEEDAAPSTQDTARTTGDAALSPTKDEAPSPVDVSPSDIPTSPSAARAAAAPPTRDRATHFHPQPRYLEGYIADWAALFNRNIDNVRNIGDRWEAWVQIELSAYLSKQVNITHAYSIERNEVIFPGGDTADIFLVSRDARYPNIGVLLCCRTSSENAAEFVERYLRYIRRCVDGVDSRRDLIRLNVFALTTDEEDLKGYLGYMTDGRPVMRYSVNRSFSRELWLLWWRGFFSNSDVHHTIQH